MVRLLVPHLQPIVKGLDKSIRAEVTGLHYAVKYKRAFLRATTTRMDHRVSSLRRVRERPLPRGCRLDPPPPLGNTDRTRYVKLTSLEDTKRPELREWIKKAGRTPGWM